MNRMFRSLPRSAWLAGAALFAVLAIFAAPASAAYPDHPIKLIVPVPPGGGVDLLSRAIGAKMQQSMGQPVISPFMPGGPRSRR